MGMCVSCESTSVSTAKVILQDGQLQEFSYPVKVSYVLAKHPTSFLCNSDDMEFDDVVSAVPDDEELQPGQLYFALPLSKLRRPLPPEEMAALAVKANAALLKRAGAEKCRCRRKCSGSVGFFGDDRAKAADGANDSVQIRRVRDRDRNRSRNDRGNGGLRSFTVNLSTIAE